MLRLWAAAAAVCLLVTGCVTTVTGTAVGPTTRTATTPGATDLSSLLLGLDDIKDILKLTEMVTEFTTTEPTAEGSYDPAECVGAVFSGMALSYAGSGFREYVDARQQDASSGGWWHWIDEAVASFDTAAAAQSYLTASLDRWRGCAWRLVFAYPTATDWQDPRVIGNPERSGCAVSVANTVEGHPDYYELRLLAAKSNIVVDLQFSGFDLNDEAAVVLGRILERIPPTGVNCAFPA